MKKNWQLLYQYTFGRHFTVAIDHKPKNRNKNCLCFPQFVKSFVLNGWPVEKRDLPDQAKPYWDYRDELTVEDDILLKGNHIVIPQSKQRFMLHKLHTSHQGIEKTKRLGEKH